MNQLRAWLYGREIETRWPANTQTPTQQLSSKIDVDLHGYQEETPGVSSHLRNTGKETVAMALTDNSNQNESSFANSLVRKFLLKVIPLQPGDCLGCKLVGTTVMAASGVIVLVSAMSGKARRNPNLQGQKLLIYNVVCGSLFIGFEAAAVCRFFDLGPFAKLAKLVNQRQVQEQK